MRHFRHILILCISLIPSISWADLVITEIMYDAEGSDTGFEWVEVYNNGKAPVTVNEWHFYENETYHGLSPENFEMLAPDEYALIVQESTNIKPQYGTHKFIKSSFSLSNEGETLGMSTPDKKIIGRVDYQNTQGAQGDGQSLQLISGSWKASLPTPGLDNVFSEPNVESESGSTTQDTEKSLVKKISDVSLKQDYFTGFLIFPDQVIQYSPTFVQAYVEHIKYAKKTKKLKGIHTLNFGDGKSISRPERIHEAHNYEYPGDYQVSFEYYESQMSKDIGEDPDVLLRKTIHVLEPSVTITDITTDFGIVINNALGQEINLEGWDIAFGNYVYTFPKYSFIRPQAHITLSKNIHQLPNIPYDEWIVLRNERKRTISSYTENQTKLRRAQDQSFQDQKEYSKEKSLSFISSKPNLDKKEVATQEDFISEYLKQHPEKKQVDFGNQNYTINNSTQEQSSLPGQSIALAAGAIALLLGIIRVRTFPLNKRKKETQTDENYGEIELIE